MAYSSVDQGTGAGTRTGNPNHAPAGSPTGGQFTSKGGGGSSTSTVRKVSVPNRKQPAVAKPAAAKPAAPLATTGHLPDLKVGANNDPARVKQLQAVIADLRLSQGPVDGTYGPQTEAAVKAIQAKLGMKPTGRASTALMKRLNDAHTLSPCVSKAGSQVHASAAEPWTYTDEDFDGEDNNDGEILHMASGGDRLDLIRWSDDTVWIVGDDVAELSVDDATAAAEALRHDVDSDWLPFELADAAALADGLELVLAAAGHDVTPGHDELHHYWTRDPRGLAKWQTSPKPWTTLRAHLLKYLPVGEATRAASQWFHEVFGFWSGSDMNRVTHGHPPRGKVIGPG